MSTRVARKGGKNPSILASRLASLNHKLFSSKTNRNVGLIPGGVSSSASDGTFVSKHFAISVGDLSRIVGDNGYFKDYRLKPGGELYVKTCFHDCSRQRKGQADNAWKLLVRRDGSFYCHRCSASGNWYQLRRRLSGSGDSLGSPLTTQLRHSADSATSAPSIPVLPNQSEAFGYHLSLTAAIHDSTASDEIRGEARHRVLTYLRKERGLNDMVLQRYGVGCAMQSFPFYPEDNEWKDHVCVTFPWMERRTGKYLIKRVKLRALDNKALQRVLPKGGSWAFFGWHTVQPHHKSVVLTEGEYDAMANIPAISLPNGCNSLPPALLPMLEQFDKIYLWLDNDKPGQEAAEKFARKLGDANDALRMNSAAASDVNAKNTESSHDRLENFANLRGEVLRSIRQPEELASGTPTKSLPSLSKKLKGFRKGELVILTGPTGCGKTTLLSQLSLDFAKEGSPTLWGSFEIRNARLVENMLQQYAGANLQALSSERLERIADDFENLPLSFMNFHAGTDLGQVLEAMDFAVYRDDVQHIIIDNLQFMMPRYNVPGLNVTGAGGSSSSGAMRSNFDKFNTQDAVIDELRRFASEKNVNIILVIHPRKEDDNQVLGMSSIFGTAKATQEADVVLIIQKQQNQHRSALAIKKNRYNGVLGRLELGFNSAVKCFYELDPPQTQSLVPSQAQTSESKNDP
eukprot:GSChrysophyteH1.ASY1.ANO1.2802.1 assembled CDS